MLNYKSVAYLLFFSLFVSACSKRIVSSNGKVWYSPSDRQPFQSSTGSAVKTDEFDNEIFIKGGSSSENANQANISQSSSDKQIEKALNNSFSVSQKSALQQQETNKSGQIDLTKNYTNGRNSVRQQNNTNSEVQSGSIVFKTKSEVSECNPCQKVNNYNARPKEEIKQVVKVNAVEKVSYKIQCGNYVNRQKAQDIANNLKKNGVSDVVVKDEGYTYKIFAGNFSNKEEGQNVFAKIKDLGYDDAFWVYK